MSGRSWRVATVSFFIFVVLLPTVALAERSAGEVRIERELAATVSFGVPSFAHNSPALATDPTEPRFVVLASRTDAPDFGCSLQLSFDGGRRFVPVQPVPKERLPRGAEKCYAPEVAFDRKGVLHYLFIGLAGAGNTPMGAFVATSKDRGRHFSRPRRVLGPNNFSVRMVIDQNGGDNGRIHLVWIRTSSAPGLGSFPPPPNPIMASYSDDGGRTFSRPVQVSDRSRAFVVAPALALGPDRQVHVLYYDLEEDAVDYHGLEGPAWEGNWSLVLASSRDGGRHFGSGVVVDDQIVPPERVMLIFTMPPPSLAVDRLGRVYAAWHDARNGDWDVFLRSSLDGGRRWEPARRVNDDERRNGRHQYLPRLSVSPRGRVDIVFYDRRNDGLNVRNDVYYTSSRTQGRTFLRNLRLTTTNFDSRFGQRYVGPAAKGLVEFGSKLGLLAREASAIIAWTDTRNAVYPVQQDIFHVEVKLQPTRRSRQSAMQRFSWAG